MNRKIKNTAVLWVLLIILCSVSGLYSLLLQRNKINQKKNYLSKLIAENELASGLTEDLAGIKKQAEHIDSLVASRKFVISTNLLQNSFYEFINSNSSEQSRYTYTNVEYVYKGNQQELDFYVYKVHGVETFNNLYRLMYNIEHSRELKKIISAEVNNNTTIDKEGIPHYFVKFNLLVKVFKSKSALFAQAKLPQKNIMPAYIHEAFYPLIRTEIIPNKDNLPDIQNGDLRSLTADGAFVSDENGNTFHLKKGDPVYLGYLIDIDYQNSTVTFTLDKGGIRENIILKIRSIVDKQRNAK